MQVDTGDTLPRFGHSDSDGVTGVVAEFSVILIEVGGQLAFLPISAAIAALYW